MPDATSSRLLLFEDDFDCVERLSGSVRTVDTSIDIWLCEAVDTPPRAVGKQRESPWTGGMDEWLDQAAVIVVDLELKSPPSGCKYGCSYCAEEFHGLHVLVRADAMGCLHKAFVASSQIAPLRRKHPDFHTFLGSLLSKGLSIFDKDNPNELATKVRAWARFSELGYYADHETRDRLFLVGQRGAQHHPEHVLILGPSGSGKEGAAEFIHEIGMNTEKARRAAIETDRRETADPKFEPLLCGGLVDASLAKSQLFGHVAGAYTDAKTHRAGSLIASLGWLPPLHWPSTDGKSKLPDPSSDFRKWILAGKVGTQSGKVLFEPDGDNDLRVMLGAPVSTVLLDEFQDLPTSVQALLLRVIDYGEMAPMGFDGRISLRDSGGRMHIRFIGASNDPRIRNQSVAGLLEPDGCGGNGTGAVGSTPVQPDPLAVGSVRHDLVSRMSNWLVDLKRVARVEAATLIAQERGYRTLAIDWSEEAVKRLERLIDCAELPGNRRQVRQVVLRASALAEYENSAGRRLGSTPVVTPEHVQQASRPISPTPHRRMTHPPGTATAGTFVVEVTKLVVATIEDLAGAAENEQTDETFKALLTELTDRLASDFDQRENFPKPAEAESALLSLATEVIARLKRKRLRWGSNSAHGNKKNRLVPALTKSILAAGVAAGKLDSGAVDRYSDSAPKP